MGYIRTMTTEYKFSEVQSIVRAAFPGAKSRRPVRIRTSQTYRVRDYWDGGSRTESVVISLETGRSVQLSQLGFVQQTMGNPFGLVMGEFPMTEKLMVVEHVISCGKDLGYRLVFHPSKEDMSQAFSEIF